MSARRSAPTAARGNLLVVEDDEAIREVLTYHLARAGHRVRTAADGLGALHEFRRERPDLVVLDLMLPRLPGLDLLRILRDEADTPVIVVSARDAEVDRVAGFDLGADDYVTKPFSLRELIARVDATLRRTAPRSGPRATPAETRVRIEVDVARHEVRRDGDRVLLTPKEFELLAYLVRHPNQVCSRDRILESVWGYTYEGETRTVDVHIHWLRQKLEDDPAHPMHLVTVRHYGYKYLPDPSITR